MAPRGRPRKSDRMEAAVEHLTKDYGFDGEVVRRVASELLETYGGDEYWYFLEQNNYLALLESMLEYQGNNNHEEIEGGALEGGALQGEAADEQALVIAEEPGGVVAAEDVAQLESEVDANLLAVEEAVPFPASPEGAIVCRSRSPCFGWIDDDGEEEPCDFILLPPPSLALE